MATLTINNSICSIPNESTICFGYLYNQIAVDDANGLAPTGWHVPSDAEWKTLESNLGMLSGELNSYNVRGAAENVGGKMKSTSSDYWDAPNIGATNSSGLGMVAGGKATTIFSNIKDVGDWWCSDAFYRQLEASNAGVNRQPSFNQTPMRSIRCIKDDSNDPKYVEDVDGNIYHTVKIGSQVWMTKNLIVTKFRDGSAIPYVSSGWNGLSTSAYTIYDNAANECDNV